MEGRQRLSLIRCTALALVLSIVGAVGLTLSAQTVRWALQPGIYSDIVPMGGGLYEVTQDGARGIVKSDGAVVVPLGMDRITDFYEGRALVLAADGHGDRVLGCLTMSGQYTAFARKYYALSGQLFFSCNLLTVEDERGRKGYVDDKGAPQIGFDGKYDNIRPFSEDYAVVRKGKNDYSLIDTRGNKQVIRVGLGGIKGLFGVYKGKAYVVSVIDSRMKCFSYDVRTRTCTDTREVSSWKTDYLDCLTELTGRGSQPTFDRLQQGLPTLSPVRHNGQYGYEQNGVTVCVAQFDEASDFIDGVAVVRTGGKCGLLRWVNDGGNFAVVSSGRSITYTQGSTVDVSFTLSAPQAWNGGELSVKLVDTATGRSRSVQSQGGGSYGFSVQPHEGVTTYAVDVSGDDLHLWMGELSFTFRRRVEVHLAIDISIEGGIPGEKVYRANENDQVPVTATVYNQGDEPVTTTVRLTGSPTLHETTQTITIDAHGSARVASYFKVESNTDADQYVRVTTDKGNQTAVEGIQLRTFY